MFTFEKLPNVVDLQQCSGNCRKDECKSEEIHKVRSFQEHICTILSSFKIVITFNNTSADFVVISAHVLLKMITFLKELRIAPLCFKSERTLVGKLDKNAFQVHRLCCRMGEGHMGFFINQICLLIFSYVFAVAILVNFDYSKAKFSQKATFGKRTSLNLPLGTYYSNPMFIFFSHLHVSTTVKCVVKQIQNTFTKVRFEDKFC